MKSITEKFCPRCGKVKSFSEFRKNKSRAYGLSAYCIECDRAMGRESYAKNPEKHLARNKKWVAEHLDYNRSRSRKWEKEHVEQSANLRFKRLYGITTQDYETMLAKQNGVCAGCGEPPKGKRLSVDHDHNTGVIRGLLCRQCNLAIAHVRESIEILEGLKKYIIEYIKGGS